MGMRIISTAISIFLSVALYSQSLTPVDSESEVKFVIRNFGINTAGTFNGLRGSIKYDPNHPENTVFDVSVDAATVDTDIAARDNHLRRSEYFDVRNFRTLEFRSTRVARTNNPNYLYVFGILTIKGVSREIKFPFTVTPAGNGFIFQGDFKLNRRDYNVGGGSISLSDDLRVYLKVFART